MPRDLAAPTTNFSGNVESKASVAGGHEAFRSIDTTSIMMTTLVNSDGHAALDSDSPARIPAWKRLGLKLRFANEYTDQPPDLRNDNLAEGKRPRDRDTWNSKEATGTEHRLRKRPRLEPPSAHSNARNDQALPPSLRRDSNAIKKTVSFTSDTKIVDGESAKSLIADWEAQYDQPSLSSNLPQNPEPAKKKASKSKNSESRFTTKKPHAALEYLTYFLQSRKSWKFSKNKEGWILKHVFSVDHVPSKYDTSLMQYLQGLKSAAARSRIRQEAEEIIRKDREETLEYTVSSSSKDDTAEVDKISSEMEDPDLRRAYYEDSVRKYKRKLEQQLDEVAVEEVRWVSPERLAKRRRAEITLWAMGVTPSSKETTQSSAAKAAPRSTSRYGNSVQGKGHPKESHQKKRKNRTTIIELLSSSGEDESSDSSSESESDIEGDDVESNSRSSSKTTATRTNTPTVTQSHKPPGLSEDTESTTSSSSSGSSSDDSASDTEDAAISPVRPKSIISISS